MWIVGGGGRDGHWTAQCGCNVDLWGLHWGALRAVPGPHWGATRAGRKGETNGGCAEGCTGFYMRCTSAA